MLMFHGPLVYLVGNYAGHTPFTEADIDLFLRHYTPADGSGVRLKEEFLNQARLRIYPQMVPDRSDHWADRRVFEPLAWISFLYRKLLEEAKGRLRPPVIAGVVERGDLREFSERVLLERVFHGLREKKNQNHFNTLFGRTDLNSPRAVLDRLGYTDSLLLAMILRPGHRTEPWTIAKYDGLRNGNVALPGESFSTTVNFAPLRSNSIGFPAVSGCYVHVSETTEPIRVEVFSELGDAQVAEAARRVYLYSRLLPRYGFPVGLDIVDKYAHVPVWLTNAYSKLLKHHLGVSVQRGRSTTRRCAVCSSRPSTFHTGTGSSVRNFRGAACPRSRPPTGPRPLRVEVTSDAADPKAQEAIRRGSCNSLRRNPGGREYEPRVQARACPRICP